MLFVVVLVIVCQMMTVQGQDSHDPCCIACVIEGQEKYYSIDTRHNNCGECCMDPADYDLYKKLEPGLEKANSSTPCSDLKYPVYLETVTHGAGNIKMTLDLYAPEGSSAKVSKN